MNLTDVLAQILESARTLVGASHSGLGVIGPDGEFSEFVHSDDPAAFSHDPIGPDTIRQATREAKPRRVAPPEAMLCVPVVVDGTAVGALCLACPADGTEFTARDEDIAIALAQSAGRAIENTALLTEARRRQD